MSPFPPRRAVALVLTHRCNLHCVYCYETRRTGRRMTADVLESVLARIASSRRIPEILLTGGEPFLEPDLVSRVLSWRRGPPFSDDRCPTVTVLTNGTVDLGDLLERLDEDGIRLQVSVDGDADVRRLHARDPSGRAVRFLETLRTRHPALFRDRVGVSMTVTPGTAPRLSASARWLLDLGVPSLSIALAMTDDGPWSGRDTLALDAEMKELARFTATDVLRTGTIRLTLFRPAMARGPSRRGGLCGATQGSCPVIDVDGRVYPCPLFVPSYQRPGEGPVRMIDPLPAVDIRDPHVAERFREQVRALARSPLFRSRHSRHTSSRRCRECPWLESCAPCPAGPGFLRDNDDPGRIPDVLCAFHCAAREAVAWLREDALAGTGVNESSLRIAEAARRLRGGV